MSLSIVNELLTIYLIFLFQPYVMTAVDAGYEDYNKSVGPSSGAYTRERGYNFQAVSIIFPGDEIFTNYGESWLDSRPNTFADNIPRLQHYDEAVAILKSIRNNSTDEDLLLNGKRLQRRLQ
jgi:hypothetical protein